MSEPAETKLPPLFRDLPVSEAIFTWRGREWRKIDKNHASPIGDDTPESVQHVPSHDVVNLETVE